MAFVKGDIIWIIAERRVPSSLKHPAIIWDEHVGDDVDFHGIMITHSEPKEQYDNILMAEEHFKPDWEIGFANTHFVNQLFIKFQEWGSFYKAGALTSDGIKFIESNLTKTDVISFVEYIAND